MISECPFCKSSLGFYTKEQVSGTVRYNFNFDGTMGENGEMYDHLSYAGGKIGYCYNCDKKLFNISDIDYPLIK